MSRQFASAGLIWIFNFAVQVHKDMNYYIILGINSGATENEIKEAYRRLAQKYHPDHYGRDASRFLKIQEAYRVLSDPQQRKKYDKRFIKKYDNVGIGGGEPEPLIPNKQAPRTDSISLFGSFDTYAPSVEEVFDRFWSNFRKSDRPKSEQIGI